MTESRDRGARDAGCHDNAPDRRGAAPGQILKHRHNSERVQLASLVVIEVNKTELLYSGQVNRNKSIFEWDHKVRFIPNILNYLLSRNIRN